MKPIVFVHSNGRSGTDYLRNMTKALYPKDVEVWHERLGPGAGARQFFRRYDATSLQGARGDLTIRGMLVAMAESSATIPYFDTGCSFHSLFPLLLQEFGDRLHIVYQVRHPFDVAASQSAWGAYHGSEALRAWDARVYLRSGDNSFRPDSRWAHRTPFEKALWRWLELDLYWEELKTRFPAASMHFVKAEDVFADPAHMDIYWRLLGVPCPSREAVTAAAQKAGRNEARDERLQWFGVGSEWQRYLEYGEVIERASRYGYSSDALALHIKSQRYRRPSYWSRALRKSGSAGSHTLGWLRRWIGRPQQDADHVTATTP